MTTRNIKGWMALGVLALTSVLMFQLWIASASAQNILTVRIDTVTIGPTDNDVIVNVRYSLKATHQHDIYSYNAWIDYDNSKIHGVDIFFDGTATEQLGTNNAIGNAHAKPNQVRAVVLGNPGDEINLSNPILFQIRFSVNGDMTDTAHITWDNWDTSLNDKMGVDSVILIDGWIRRVIPVKPPPPKDTINLLMRKATVETDSSIEIPVQLSNLTGANLKNGVFSFGFDTSLLQYKSVRPGDLIDTTSGHLQGEQSASNQLAFFFSRADTSQTLSGTGGNGVLMYITFQAKHRTDTNCASIINPALLSRNDDALIAKVNYDIGDICVEGRPDAQNGVDRSGQASSQVVVWPNPARNEVHFSSSSAKQLTVRVFDILGRQVFESKLEGSVTWHPLQGLAGGVYSVVVSDDAQRSARNTSSTIVLMP